MSLLVGFKGSLAADVIAMPVHWYYNRELLDRDYPELTPPQAPREIHPDSILWRSQYEAGNEMGEIVHDREAWGQREVHYHRNLVAGENTMNFKLAQALYDQVTEAGEYNIDSWVKKYIEAMLTPGWHNDTYIEEYHRGFFTNYSKGKKPEKCGIRDEHIGGLATVPALVAALAEMPLEDVRPIVKAHVALTHRHSNVLRAADCLVRILHHTAAGAPLRQVIMEAAGDWFSTKKAETWSRQEDRVVIGQKLSPACYIAEAFPAALYLAWKYHDGFDAAIEANARVGGDSCHRGAIVGSLVAINQHREDPCI
ncbi:ADP-ribosylglycohydrolase family protein [Verrucomicrobiales bacterium]|nr:ADP-ribosylglycohydrolase family protein [Verrucomicrobiales bacterium]